MPNHAILLGSIEKILLNIRWLLFDEFYEYYPILHVILKNIQYYIHITQYYMPILGSIQQNITQYYISYWEIVNSIIYWVLGNIQFNIT